VRCHLLGSRGRFRALTALTLLAPGTPMLFMGQEFAASSPFQFFADHGPQLAEPVRKGRREFMSQFPSNATPEVQALLPDPCDVRTFERCKLDLAERERGWHAQVYAMHKDLLRLRREQPAFASQSRVDGAVLADEAFVVRFFDAAGDRLLVVNLGPDLRFFPSPEPLLGPPENCRWQLLWSSEDPRYGGAGTPAVETDDGWFIPAHTAVVVQPVEET
jgi:maltooligosyltrehalose trehalohydrolase